MRALLILIKREIVDHLVYFVAAAVVSGLVTAVIIAESGEALDAALVTLAVASIVAVPGLASLGATQMYMDRTRNISAFLTVLPVTRGQLFAARILAGVLVVLVLLIPAAVAGVVTIDIGLAELPFQRGLIGGMLWGALAASLACYSIGLYAGWNRRSLGPTLGLLPIVFLIPTLIVIKGFGLEAIVVLSVLTVACLTAAWCRFSSSSL